MPVKQKEERQFLPLEFLHQMARTIKVGLPHGPLGLGDVDEPRVEFRQLWNDVVLDVAEDGVATLNVVATDVDGVEAVERSKSADIGRGQGRFLPNFYL